MGKGTENWEKMMARVRAEGTPAEQRRKLRPELRLAPDVVVDAGSDTSTREALGHLAGEGVRCVEVRDEELGVDAVVIPAERYVEIMTRLLEVEGPHITPRDHQLYPPRLAESNLEQVDPDANWDAFFRFGGPY